MSLLHQLDAAVLGAAGLGGVAGQGLGLAKAGGGQAGLRDALGREGSHHGAGAGLAQGLVVSGRTGVVGVALHGHAQGGAADEEFLDFG